MREQTHVPLVVSQHVEEAAQLRNVRSVLVGAANVSLRQLGRLDERLAAHLDGIAVAGDDGATLAKQALVRPGRGEVFVATVRAIQSRDEAWLDKLLAIAETIAASRSGLLSAFGWVSAAELQGLTKTLLESQSARRREIGLAACAMHGVNPGPALDLAMRDRDPELRARGLRVAGLCGRLDLAEACFAGLADPDPRCAFEAAGAALLLGDRTACVAALEALAVDGDAALSQSALELVLKVSEPHRAQSILATLAKRTALPRTLIRGIAAAGDPHYVPWLIAQMSDVKLARIAGETFSFITGFDIAYLDLEIKPPEDGGAGPNDDPADDNVAMDEDDSLPWPDPTKIEAWWQANGARFEKGTRYFMGASPSPSTCLDVLETGFQRQRSAAAQHLSLLSPGRPVFNTSAPTWRQKRLLSKMRG